MTAPCLPRDLYQNYRALAGAIVSRALVDVLVGGGGAARSALQFFRSPWFEVLADALGLDCPAIRERVLDSEWRKKAREKLRVTGAVDDRACIGLRVLDAVLMLDKKTG